MMSVGVRQQVEMGGMRECFKCNSMVVSSRQVGTENDERKEARAYKHFQTFVSRYMHLLTLGLDTSKSRLPSLCAIEMIFSLSPDAWASEISSIR